MLKLLLQHLLALAVAVLVGTLLAVAVTDVLLPPPIPGLAPRMPLIAVYAAWIAGGVHVALSVILAVRRWRRESTDPFAVGTRTLFVTWGFMIGLSVVVCLLNESTDWFN